MASMLTLKAPISRYCSSPIGHLGLTRLNNSCRLASPQGPESSQQPASMANRSHLWSLRSKHSTGTRASFSHYSQEANFSSPLTMQILSGLVSRNITASSVIPTSGAAPPSSPRRSASRDPSTKPARRWASPRTRKSSKQARPLSSIFVNPATRRSQTEDAPGTIRDTIPKNGGSFVSTICRTSSRSKRSARGSGSTSRTLQNKSSGRSIKGSATGGSGSTVLSSKASSSMTKKGSGL